MLKSYLRYFDFKGRSNRAELISFALFQLVVSGALYGYGVAQTNELAKELSIGFLALSFLPSISVQVRRLHDSGKSGWRLLWLLAPGIGALILLFSLLRKGDVAPNRFGPPPGRQTHAAVLPDTLEKLASAPPQ
jgi:uncharacterized membrane protein YhaH (DUF805 family)